MKKYRTTPEYTKYNNKHARDQLYRRLRFNDRKKRYARQFQKRVKGELTPVAKNAHKYWDYKEITAPVNFSLIANTEEVVVFINLLSEYQQKRKKVWVKLRKVGNIDFGAIVVLLSIMVQFKAHKIEFNGDFPKNENAKKMLVNSGFFYNLYFRDQERYDILPNSNSIHTHAWKEVDAKLGEEIIVAASKTIWGEPRRCQGVQRTLIELMQNTNNHAVIGTEGEKHWWLSVNHSLETKKVTFSFIDFGVGVFTNLNNKPQSSKFHNWISKLSKQFKFGNNAELLKLILEGKLHLTVTDKHFRGKGLPGIAEVQQRNQISNLHIITNDVRCNVKSNDFSILRNSFNGTFVSWELGENNENCK